jgi:hypothetical protein
MIEFPTGQYKKIFFYLLFYKKKIVTDIFSFDLQVKQTNDFINIYFIFHSIFTSDINNNKISSSSKIIF